MARYSLNGIEYPSVTEIIDACTDKSAQLTQWSANQTAEYIKQNFVDGCNILELCDKARFEFRNVSKEAKDIGSQVHDLIEHYIKFGLDKTGKMEYPETVQNAFLAFLDWEQNYKVKWIESEFQIYDNDLFYAGTCDAICEIDGKRYIIDFKTSKGFYDGYDLQIAAYFFAYNKHNEAVQYAGILRIDKESGLPEFKDYSEGIERKYRAFTCLLDYFYLIKNRRLKNNPRVKGVAA